MARRGVVVVWWCVVCGGVWWCVCVGGGRGEGEEVRGGGVEFWTLSAWRGA